MRAHALSVLDTELSLVNPKLRTHGLKDSWQRDLPGIKPANGL